MNDVTNPHDKLFRETWSDRDTAVDFLTNYLPSQVLQCVDLTTLEITKDSFVDQELHAYFSDILYKVKIAGEIGYIYLLFEHKSFPERWIHLQLLEYMLKIWRLYLQQHKGRKRPRLPVILPMVLYHSPERWPASIQFREMFVRLPEALNSYIPDFAYLLYDLSRYADDEIRGAVLSRVVLLLFKHVFDPDIEQRLPQILSLLEEILDEPSGLRVLEMLLRYIVSATEHVSKENILPIVGDVLSAHKGGEIVMTLAEQWKQEGFQQGTIQGKIQGIYEGLLEGIELGISLKFGEEGLKLMPFIQTLHELEQLKAVKEAIKTARNLAEFQRLLDSLKDL